jgi:hypothetical protein
VPGNQIYLDRSTLPPALAGTAFCPTGRIDQSRIGQAIMRLSTDPQMRFACQCPPIRGRTAVPTRRTARSARGKNTKKSQYFCTEYVYYGRTHTSTRRESLPCTQTSRRQPARPRPHHANRMDLATRATPAGFAHPSARNRPCRHL